eukprot:UN09290
MKGHTRGLIFRKCMAASTTSLHIVVYEARLGFIIKVPAYKSHIFRSA